MQIGRVVRPGRTHEVSLAVRNLLGEFDLRFDDLMHRSIGLFVPMKLFRVFAETLLVAFAAWATAAIWIDGPQASGTAAITVLLLLASSAGLFFATRRVIPIRLVSILTAALPSLGVLVWWLNISASQDRTWLAEVERPARVEID